MNGADAELRVAARALLRARVAQAVAGVSADREAIRAWDRFALAIDAAEDAARLTPTATETGTYPCCGECGPGCSGRHESRCHCQTAELLAIADEGAARARGAL